MIKKILLTLIAILFITLAFVLSTNLGLKATLSLANWFVPGKISTQQLEGSLLSSIRFKQLTYSDGTLIYVLENGTLDYKISSLFKGRLSLSDFSSQHVFVIKNNETLLTLKQLAMSGIVSYSMIDIAVLIDQIDLNSIVMFDNNTLSIIGPYENYTIHGEGQHEEDKWQLQASGSLNSLDVNTLQLKSQQGAVDGTATLDWSAGLTWQAAIEARELATQLILPETLGVVSFDLKSQGRYDTVMSGDLAIEQISGEINTLALDGYLRLTSEENHIEVDTAIHYGNASIVTQGEINEQWQLGWNIDIPNLHIFSPLLRGNIVSDGNVVGEKLQPIMNATLSVNDLFWDVIQVQSLNGFFDVDFTSRGNLNATIDIQQLSYGFIEIEKIKLLLSGNTEQHQLATSINQADNIWQMTLNGSLINNLNWQATLAQFSLQSSLFGQWQLSEPTDIIVSDKNISVSSFDWRNDEQFIQAHYHWQEKDNQIDASLLSNFTALGIIDDFLIQAQQLQGHLLTDITVTGNIEKPIATGHLTITDFGIDLPEIGLVIRDTDIHTTIEDNHLILDTALRSEEGDLTLHANMGFSDFKPVIDATITGTNFQIINSPMMMAKVSPSLNFHFSNSHMKLSGNLHVDEANIKPLDFSNVQEPSEDIVFINDPDTEQAKNRITQDINLTVSLSDKVYLNSFGFTGYIIGRLNIKTNNDQLLIATGELNAVNGEFSLLGRLFNIVDGNIIYTNTSINNPGLYIVAQASGFFTSEVSGNTSNLSTNTNTSTTVQTDSIAIVIRATIQGSANNPDITLSSTPAMSQSDIISYLVLGRPSSSLNSADAQMVLALAGALGSGDKNLVRDVRDSLGLDELTLGSGTRTGENNEQVNTTSLIVGKYITPKIYIGSRIGLTDPNSTFLIRYILSRRWMLQTESGNDQNSIDLFYTIERGKRD